MSQISECVNTFRHLRESSAVRRKDVVNTLTICKDLQTAELNCKTLTGEIVKVLIDIDDIKKVSVIPGTWGTSKTNSSTTYCSTLVDGKRIFLHRLIMDFPTNLEVDHYDADGLNNKRSNLTAVTRQQNAAKARIPAKANKNSKSGERGITFTKSGKYSVSFGGKWVGTYLDLTDARDKYEGLRQAVNILRTGRA